MRPRPPRKRHGVSTGRRRINGAVKDVAGVAEFLGETEKAVRAQVARGLLPHRRYGGRVIFITAEIETFLRALPGISHDQALANIAARAGRDGAEAR